MSSVVFADLIPSTSPCWVKGTVSIGGSVANSDGAVLTATVAGTQQKSSTLDETGVFDFNSLAGNDGDTVILKVCGLYNSSDTNMQFTFTGFCNTTDAQPWITKTINYSEQADGTTGCTCSAVCSGGYCVNPGSSGICSSNSYYCDSDDTCESEFGETTSTCSDDCHSGGGGGGGGGSIPNPRTSQTWINVTPGLAIIMNIASDDFGIKQITIYVNNPVQNVQITIEKLTGFPASMIQIIGKVYRYLLITTKNLDDSNIKGMIKIKFQVSQSWLLSNSVDANKMVLMRYVNGTWVELKTTLLSTDSKYAYYESETPGLSYFAIAVSSGAATTPTMTPNATTTPTTTPNATTTPTEPVEEPAVQPPAGTTETTGKKPSTLATILVMLAVIIIIALIIIGVGRKKKPSHQQIIGDAEE